MSTMNSTAEPDADDSAESLAALLLQAAADVAPQAPSPDTAAHMRARVWRRIAAEGAPQACADAGFFTIPADEGWVQAEGMPDGVMMKMLFDDGVTATWLGRMPPGCELPAHRHVGPEECLVLEGDLWLNEVHLRKGDYQFAAHGTTHHSVRSPTGCTLLGRTASAAAPRPQRQAVT